MRITATSDIHGYEPFVGRGDTLIFAGDVTPMGKETEVVSFARYLSTIALDFKDIIVVGGNHDFLLEQFPVLSKQLMGYWMPYDGANLHYLCDSGVTIDGIKFWGSPWTPKFGNWAFMKEDAELAEKWALIPSDTDVLITHGPPFGILDYTNRYGATNVGSETLLKAYNRIDPQAHIFGHIHEAYGETTGFSTRFYNVAYCDEDYEPVNFPAVIVMEA